MVLFFGPPGSGKSVQGQQLVERNGWRWISTGELFRSSHDPEVIERLASGELIDDELTNKVLASALAAINPAIKVVLDGYPRNVDQAHWLHEHLGEYGRKVDCIILFEVPRVTLLERLVGRGRDEDTPEVIGRRLDIYDEKTKPVLDFYQSINAPIKQVDGTGEIPVIHERVQEAVVSCLPTA